MLYDGGSDGTEEIDLSVPPSLPTFIHLVAVVPDAAIARVAVLTWQQQFMFQADSYPYLDWQIADQNFLRGICAAAGSTLLILGCNCDQLAAMLLQKALVPAPGCSCGTRWALKGTLNAFLILQVMYLLIPDQADLWEHGTAAPAA